MYLFVHATVGAVIGKAVPNPVLAFGIGLLSHFALDRIPHKDPPVSEDDLHQKVSLRSRRLRPFLLFAALDLVLALGLGAALLVGHGFASPISGAAGMLGGMLPDLLFGLYCLTGNRTLGKFDAFHQRLHFDPKKYPVNWINGMVTQVATLGIAITYLWRR